MPNILLGCTGSVASLKIPALIDILNQLPNVTVKLLPTKNSLNFFDIDLCKCQVLLDEDEWKVHLFYSSGKHEKMKFCILAY